MKEKILDTSTLQPIYKREYAVPVTVSASATEFETTADGKKIVKAGTIVSSTKPLTADLQAATVGTDNTNGKGILISDVDITDGDAVGTAMTKGIVFAERIPNAPTTINYDDLLGNGLIQAVSIKR